MIPRTRGNIGSTATLDMLIEDRGLNPRMRTSTTEVGRNYMTETDANQRAQRNLETKYPGRALAS
jgi:hypothetical protein